MWQKVNEAFSYIKKSPNPGVLHTLCLFPGCPWAEIHCHTQLPALHRGADWSHHPGNLQVSPFSWGNFLVSFIPHIDTAPSWDRAVLCYLPCANGRCSSNPLKFCLPFFFPRQCLIHLGATHSHGKPQPFPLASFLSWFFTSRNFLSALNTGFMLAQSAPLWI